MFSTEMAIAEIQTRAAMAKTSILDVCRLAGVAPITLIRWERGDSTPTLRILKKFDKALSDLERKKKK